MLPLPPSELPAACKYPKICSCKSNRLTRACNCTPKRDRTYEYDSCNLYTGCPGGNVPDFGRMFLTLKYTDITRNTYVYPKLNGYGDKGERKVRSSCGSTYCTCFACCYPYTAHVRPSVSQPSQAHSVFIINRCHSFSEL